MNRVIVCALVVLLSTVGTAAAGEQVKVCGTETSLDLLRTVGTAFEKANPGVAVVVPDGIGSDGGVKAAADGECDFGRVSRLLTDREKDLKLTYRVFAYLPVVFVVDPATGVENLTSKQIVDIFSGNIDAWAEVGGQGGKIAVVNRGAKDPSRVEVGTHIKGFKAIEKPVGATVSKASEAVDLLSKTPGAIGYLPLPMTKGRNLRVVKVDGVAPTSSSVAQGAYDLAAPLGLVWKGELKPEAKRFLHFLKSDEGRKIVKKYGTIPVDRL